MVDIAVMVVVRITVDCSVMVTMAIPMYQTVKSKAFVMMHVSMGNIRVKNEQKGKGKGECKKLASYEKKQIITITLPQP